MKHFRKGFTSFVHIKGVTRTRAVARLTNDANEQSDKNEIYLSTMSRNNETNAISIDEMVKIIKLKDQQIAKLQTTIDEQSLQIKQQTAAIETMQKQMTELTSNLALLVKRSDKPPAKEIAPIFSMCKNDASKSSDIKGKKCKTKMPSDSSNPTKALSVSPSLAPTPKRSRHLMENELNNSSTSGFDRNNTISTVPPTIFTDDTLNVNNDLNDVKDSSMNDSSKSSDNNSLCVENDNDLNDSCLNEGENFVNFKKNSISKEKNITPIEISIKSNEKGSLHALFIKHLNNNSFMWSNASKRCIRINPFTQVVKDAMIKWLQNRQYQFHTFLSKENKPNAFIIRGLPDSISQAHIGNALQQAGILFTSLERHSTGYTRSHHLLSDLWRVKTPSTVTLQHFKAIDGILNVKIRVEVLKRSPVLYGGLP